VRVSNSLADSAITTVKLLDANVTAAKLSASAIKLGITKITSSFTTTSATAVQVTGGSLSLTIPGNGRDILIIAHLPATQINSAPGQFGTEMWDGTVGSGTKLADVNSLLSNSGINIGTTLFALLSAPSAGSKTINLGLRSNPGGTTTTTSSMSASLPGLIIAIMI
jgi:hypothetical protein